MLDYTCALGDSDWRTLSFRPFIFGTASVTYMFPSAWRVLYQNPFQIARLGSFLGRIT